MFTYNTGRNLAFLALVLVGGVLLAWDAGLIGDDNSVFSSDTASDISYPLTGLNLGRAASVQDIAGWNISIYPDGANLPAGSGNVLEGKALYMDICADCHGTTGAGKTGEELVGGVGIAAGEEGALNSPYPEKTVGNYWPYATTLFDYIRRAMPPSAPLSLTADQIYALSAYLLFLNDIIDESEVMDAKTLPAILMPNRNGFVRINLQAR
ncbi:MAG: cytochrome c [Alphaproteobacteria bacterium]|nr:cytochrome c [Alphaproteobacteria bacterium]